MTASRSDTEALTLIRTKLQKPRLPGGLSPRRRLLDRLHAGVDRKMTRISAMAGTGKTTLLALAELILYAPAQDAIAALVLMFAGNKVKGLKAKGFVSDLIAAVAIAVVSWLIDGVIGLFS